MAASIFGRRGQRVVLSEYGETPLDAVDNFCSLEEFAPPAEESLGADDVLVSIESASVNWVDLLMASGLYQHKVKPPYCPGLEYSGVVEWVGSGVDKFEIGARVMVDGLKAGPRSSGRYQQYGGFASYALAPQDSLLPVPESLSFDQACGLLGAYETAYHCLVTNAQLQAGEVVLIHGASGATGLAAVHVAKLLGATVIATGRSDSKLAIVREQGADHIVKSCGEDGEVRRFRDEVKALTNGVGVDVVYDGVGGAISLESLRCVQFGARFLIVGWAGTPFVAKGKGAGGAPNANLLPTNLIMMKGLRVLGCPMVIATEKQPSIREQRLSRILSWASAGEIIPYLSHRFPLTDYKDALYAKWEGKVVGGCVLHPKASDAVA